MFLVPSTAFVAALLFAIHPIHTEAVSLSLCNQMILPSHSTVCLQISCTIYNLAE